MVPDARRRPAGTRARTAELPRSECRRRRDRSWRRRTGPGGTVAEQQTTDPSARTSRSAETWPAMPVKSLPVPWVPVEMAPAMVWVSMSPMFSRARPYGPSSAGQLPQPGARAQPDHSGREVDRAQPAQSIQPQADAVGGGDRGEGMAGTDRSDGQAIALRPSQHRPGVRSRPPAFPPVVGWATTDRPQFRHTVWVAVTETPALRPDTSAVRR